MARRPSGYFVREYGQELAIVNTRAQTVLLILLLALLFALPLLYLVMESRRKMISAAAKH